ncbi:MAG: ShlB/FhaC/HecB family hemolysin secretion/activation protein [Luteolibacter sp.]
MRFLLPLFLAATGAQAQLVPGVDPVLPEAGVVDSLEAVPVAEANTAGQGAVLAERLEVIQLDSGSGVDFQKKTAGLEISGDLTMPAPGALGKVLGKWIAKPLREGDLPAIADEILIHFDQEGYPMVVIDLPEQDLASGKLRFFVEIGRIANVGVARPKYGNPDAVTQGLTMRSGDLLRRREIDGQMAWYGRSIFRKPRLFVSPGLESATADLLIGLEERRPWRATLGYENSGQVILGRDQFIFGIAGMTPGEYILAYQTVIGESPSVLQAHALSWEIPFHTIHQTLQLDAAYAEVETSSSIGGLPVENDGTSWSFSAMQKARLPLGGKWRQTLAAGFELKSTDQFVLFGGGDVSPGEVRFLAGKVSYNLAREWDDGAVSFGANLVASPGGLIRGNDDSDFQKYDAAADSSYLIGRFSGQGWWTPGGDWRLALRGGAQVTDSRLLAAEQFAAGGHATVRGVAEREFLADEGWHGSIEVLAPEISIAGDFRMRFLGFYDHAWLKNRNRDSQSLSGAGFGARAKLTDHVDLRIDHGWRLDESGSRTHLGVLFAF